MTAPRPRSFRCFLLGLVSAPLLLALLLLVTARLWLPAIGQWLAFPPQISASDAIVVLSGGGPERIVQGIALYRQGLAPELWYTGDRSISAMSNFTDGQFARDFALAQGIPADAIRLLPTTSTWEDGQEIALLADQEQLHSLLIVTNWYHSRRALCVIRRHLAGEVQLYYSPPPMLTYGPDDWWRQEDGLVAVVNEMIKFGFYGVRYGLAPWRC